MTTMTFAEAQKLFEQGKYQEALEAYEELGKIYGQAVVEYNIQVCKKHLQANISTKSRAVNSTVNETSRADRINQRPKKFNLAELPLVSVVMPVFNVAPYLDASILSVLRQSYKNIELIIINDASTDNGLDIINMYSQQDTRIKVINLEFNTLGGAGIPSNVGINQAKGKYLAFADSDDILDEFAIEKMVTQAEQLNAEVVVADFCTFNDETREITPSYDKGFWEKLPIEKIFSPRQYPTCFMLSPVPWRKLYDMKFINTHHIRFPECDYFYEDNPLHWNVLNNAQKIAMINHVAAYHRMGREGQTMTANAYKLASLLSHINNIRRMIKRSPNTAVAIQFAEFIMKCRWIINRQSDKTLKNLISKRFSQEINKIDFLDKAFFEQKYGLKFTSLGKAYPNLDLTLVVFIDEDENVDTVIQKIKLVTKQIKHTVFDVFLIHHQEKPDHEYQSMLVEGINVSLISVNNKNLYVLNSVIPLCSGKYTFFVKSNSLEVALNIDQIIDEAKKNRLDTMYPESLVSKTGLHNIVIRSNHMRDMEIFFSKSGFASYTFLFNMLIKTPKKLKSKHLNIEGKNSSIGDVIKHTDIIHDSHELIKKNIFKQANVDDKKTILDVISKLISQSQGAIDQTSWSQEYLNEFNSIIKYL